MKLFPNQNGSQVVVAGLLASGPLLILLLTLCFHSIVAEPVDAQAVGRSLANEWKDESVWLIKVPFVAKKPDFGGEACLAAVLKARGENVDQDFVFDMSGVDPVEGRGCVSFELSRAAKKCGFQVGDVWYKADNSKQLNVAWKTIFADLKNGSPSIVVAYQKGVERFVLVVGFDATTDQVIYHDPNQDNGASQKFDRSKFLASMLLPTTLGDKVGAQAVVIRTRGQLKKLKASDEKYSNADYAQHIRLLKKKLPNKEFTIVLQKPFVVVGDAGKRNVERTAEGTVKWAVDRVKQEYFKRDPYEILDVWLFKNPESYNKHNVELFGSKPSTPYGYYSSQHKSLVMDISTGGGTLVHEIVHPFMESNFVLCPSWFNEGLASLYEQSATRQGRIVGLTNWRLRGLQQTIKAKRLPTFKELCETSTREFYQGAGTNYAQARYLCYYLQQHDLLNEYYHAFVKNARDDPSGFATLKKVLERDDMQQFQKEWEKYVMLLKYR